MQVSPAFILLSIAMLVVGAVLFWPRIYLHGSLASVRADDVDVYRLPLEGGRVELAVAFTYAVEGELLGRPDDLYQVLAWDRCDRLGRILPPLVLSDAEAGDLVQRIRGQGGSWRAWYDPQQPLTSGRIQFSQEGGFLEFLDAIGFALMLTPVVVWTVLALIHLSARRLNHVKRRTL